MLDYLVPETAGKLLSIIKALGVSYTLIVERKVPLTSKTAFYPPRIRSGCDGRCGHLPDDVFCHG
jgi:hypothetical protein